MLNMFNVSKRIMSHHVASCRDMNFLGLCKARQIQTESKLIFEELLLLLLQLLRLCELKLKVKVAWRDYQLSLIHI